VLGALLLLADGRPGLSQVLRGFALARTKVPWIEHQ